MVGYNFFCLCHISSNRRWPCLADAKINFSGKMIVGYQAGLAVLAILKQMTIGSTGLWGACGKTI